MYAQEIKRIFQRLNYNNGNVLDVGCGMGDFLSGFPSSWKKYGVEISDYAKNAARAKGIYIKENSHAYEYPKNFFDLVVFRGTLQHLDKPLWVLQRVTELLTRDGLLVILATPNSRSLVYRLWGDLPMLDPERNFWIPGDKELKNILHNLWYTDIEFYYPYRGTPYAQPAKDYWKFIKQLFGIKNKFAFPGNMMECYARKKYR